MKITVPKNWNELNEWQLTEIAYLLLTTNEDIIDKTYFEIVKILFKKSDSIKSTLQMHSVFNQVPYSTLIEYADFIKDTPEVYHFPNLGIKGIKAPGDRLNSFTIKQFSVADTIFYKWNETKDEIYLRQLVATLYTFEKGFDALKLPDVANKTDNISIKKAYAILFIYMSVRNYITDSYPKIFPKPPKTEEQLIPVFASSKKYTPFSKIIATMAMDERQPFGPLDQCNNTLIYDFFNTLTESIIQTEKKIKQAAK